jgi:hypothetical protein
MSEFKIGDKFISKISIFGARTEGKIYEVVDKGTSINKNVVWYINDKGSRVWTENNENLEWIKEKSEVIDMENLLTFDQLQEGVCYRLLHGGEKDHGYNYVLKNGVLFNQNKGKNSSIPFNTKTRFIETKNKFLTLPSLDNEYIIEFHSKGAKVGCQNISIEDLKELAAQIFVRYN